MSGGVVSVQSAAAAETSASGGLAAADVFVRILTVPSESPARIRAAIELQLDRLTPLPPETVAYAWAALADADRKARRYAVAVARKELMHAVALACEPPLDAVVHERTVEGVALTFAFSTPFGTERRRRRWLARAPGMIASLVGAGVLLLALTYRLNGENRALVAELASLETAQTAARRAAAEQGVAAALWRSASEARLSASLRCALTGLATSAPGVAIASLDARGGEVRVTLSEVATANQAQAVRTLGADVAPAPESGGGSIVRFSSATSCDGAAR